MNYSQLISESESELIILECTQKRVTARNRVRFILLLKTKLVHSQAQAGQLIGLEPRQSQRLWQTYRQKGLTALLDTGHGGQYKGKLNPAQFNQLKSLVRSNSISQLSELQDYLQQNFGVNYSIAGLSALLVRIG